MRSNNYSVVSSRYTEALTTFHQGQNTAYETLYILILALTDVTVIGLKKKKGLGSLYKTFSRVCFRVRGTRKLCQTSPVVKKLPLQNPTPPTSESLVKC